MVSWFCLLQVRNQCLKERYTLVIIQNKYYLKNWLGNEHWRAVDSIKHCGKWFLMSNVVFWERGNFSLKYLKAHIFIQQGYGIPKPTPVGCKRGNPVSALGVGGNSFWNKNVLSHTLKWPSCLVSLATCIKKIIFSQLWWPIEPKFSQACYFMLMMGYTKWEHWSLIITKRVQPAHFLLNRK